MIYRQFRFAGSEMVFRLRRHPAWALSWLVSWLITMANRFFMSYLQIPYFPPDFKCERRPEHEMGVVQAGI